MESCGPALPPPPPPRGAGCPPPPCRRGSPARRGARLARSAAFAAAQDTARNSVELRRARVLVCIDSYDGESRLILQHFFEIYKIYMQREKKKKKKHCPTQSFFQPKRNLFVCEKKNTIRKTNGGKQRKTTQIKTNLAELSQAFFNL